MPSSSCIHAVSDVRFIGHMHGVLLLMLLLMLLLIKC